MGFEKNFQYGWEVGKMGSWEVMKLLIDIAPSGDFSS
jgi:hypothetical protein